MPIQVSDPRDEVFNRIREIMSRPATHVIDRQERFEREEAADAYAGENEKHFADYARDCIEQSRKAMHEVRRIQSVLYDMYLEKEPSFYADKEDWQNRIVVPKPFGAVQFGMAAVKKAFQPRFLSIDNYTNKASAEFWEKLMTFQHNEQHARFRQVFTIASGMGLAIGHSLEMIPRWVKGKGLQYTLVEPWKIDRDPDAITMDPQSGMFWIHSEWVDYFVLKEGEKKGIYHDVDRAKDHGGSSIANDGLTKEELKLKRGYIHQKSKFRKLIFTSEFWGTVLDPRGEVLLPNGYYTVAAGLHVIKKPRMTGFHNIRWPGMSFSPLPDFLRFGGRGLLEGVKSLWEYMCNMMCLHADYQTWIVNPETEINVDALVDPTDVERWPGKTYLTKNTLSGNQVVRTTDRRFITNDILPNLAYADQNFQRGTFINDAIQGLPGYRKDMTWRESQMLLEQALGVFGLIGENSEWGAVDSLKASADVVRANISIQELREVFGKEADQFIDLESPTGTGLSLPVLDGSFHISGLSTIAKEAETIKAIAEQFAPMAERPPWAKYMNPYQILKALEERTNVKDEGFCVEPEMAKKIDNMIRMMNIQLEFFKEHGMLESGEEPKNESGRSQPKPRA